MQIDKVRINRKWEVRIAIILILFIVIFVTLFPKTKEQRIKNNALFTVGKIISIEDGHRAAPAFYYYKYVVNKDTISSDRSGNSIKYIFLNKSFPIIFNSNKPKENRMLIYPRDFERFDIAFPDSLNWVKQYDSDSVIEFF